MAPDLNSLPPSPYRPRHTASSSRRSSELRVPTTTSLPSSNPQSPSLPFRELAAPPMYSPGVPPVDNTGVGIGPGPLRHPRPLTAADLHMQLEKEQEAVVNRLTRELTLLRQQTASVVSNTSSTSERVADVSDQTAHSVMSGTSHAHPSSRHRSSSSLSSRNASAATSLTTGNTGTSGSTLGTTAGVTGSSTSGIAPPRDTSAPYGHGYSRDSLSRQSSVASRRSEASSPSLSSSLIQGDHFPNMYAHRHSSSISRPQHGGSLQDAPTSAGPRSSQFSNSARHEEGHYRSELENVRKENEELKRRIRELERSLSSRQQSDSGQVRSVSVSTNASVPIATARDRLVDNDLDAVEIGESAASSGFGDGR